ncbi:hypothetical protein P4S88_15375 [Anoxybacillus geothermalis]|nr:hypothetical protein [Anoxybacillus geothermalis]
MSTKNFLHISKDKRTVSVPKHDVFHAIADPTRRQMLQLLAAAGIVPLFLFLTVQIKAFVAAYWPVVEHVPTIIVFLVTLYPIYWLYERANATILCKKGRFQVKKGCSASKDVAPPKWEKERCDPQRHVQV